MLLLNKKLPKEQRLANKCEFAKVFQQKNKLRFRFIVAYLCENKLGIPRLGIVIGKKNLKLAVNRNRLRRVLRESFRLNQGWFKGVDLVLVLCEPIDVSEISAEDWLSLWQRLRARRTCIAAA